MSEPRAMREIHAIREQIYEETKDMSPQEYAEYSRRNSEELDLCLLELGYKFVPVEGEPGVMRLVRI